MAVFAAYSNSFDAGLVFDNQPIISEDPRIRQASLENVRSIVDGQYWYNSTTSGLYRPLTTLSYLANYAVAGNHARPAGYHAINLALHAINVALVYALGFSIFGDPVLAMCAAALWGLHPLATESVTNIVGRADLLAAFGVLAGLLCYIRSASAQGSRRITWLVAMVGCQTVGLFSKEGAIVLPALLLLYDLIWLDLSSRRRRSVAYAILAVPITAFFWMRVQSHAHLLVNFAENPLIAAGFWTARLTAIKVIGRFLWLFVWPASLSADYSYNAIPVAVDAGALAALIASIALVFAALRLRDRSKPLWFGVIFFWIALAPTANLVMIIGSIMAERFMYLPAIGLAASAVALLAMLDRRAAIAAAALASVVLGARTYVRNFDWYDGVSLWSSAIQVNPQAARAHNNLAFEYSRIPGRMPDAIAEYQAALRIRPDYPEAHFNLGNALRQTSRIGEAIAEYEAAVQSAPAYVEARLNLGNALLDSGRAPQAIPQFRAVMQFRPDSAEAHNSLGNAWLRTPGHLPDAIAECRIALRLRPDYAEAHNNLGNALLQSGGLSDAVAEFQTAIRIRPEYAEAHANLGSAVLQSGRLNDAIAEYQTATRIQPGLADAHYNLANALLRARRVPEAIAEFEAVLRIAPDPEVSRMLAQLRAK